MTLLDFELHMRPVKVIRGRNMFLKDQVLELSADGDVWEAKIKFGQYEVSVGIDKLSLAGSSCKCDARRYTHYCEHAVAVLFAVRKELGLKPILASVIPKIPCIDYSLVNLLESFNTFEYEITDEDILTFAGEVEQMLESMEGAFKKHDYQTISNEGKNWMDLLLAGANNATRKDQFTRTMNALCILVKGSENKSDQEMYVKQFLHYRFKCHNFVII